MSLSILLEKLAEMFPKQDYQDRLERYVAAKNPKNTAELENLINRFERNENKGLFQ